MLAQTLQTRLEGRSVRRAVAQAEFEAIAPVHPAAQLARMPPQLEHAHVSVGFQLLPLRLRTPRKTHAEPLASQRVAILEAAEADVGQGNATQVGQPLLQLHRVETPLLQIEKGVLPLPFGREAELLDHQEILRACPQSCLAQCRTVGPG